MGVLSYTVPVPTTGLGPSVDVSALVGPKTVQLSGLFAGRYNLLASHDDVRFDPVLTFDAGGEAEVEQVLEGTYRSFRIESRATALGSVACHVSGVGGAGENYFLTIASMGAGFTGTTPVVDTAIAIPPTGAESAICFLARGAFRGTLVVLGSVDGIEFNPVGSWRCDRIPEGASDDVELAPLVTLDLVRYVRVQVIGYTTGPLVVTMGGRIEHTASTTLTLAQTYANGAAAIDQTLVLLNTKGGPLVVDGTSPGFTNPSALVVRGNLQVAGASSLAVGVATPTARVHPAAGTAAAGTAPLKISPGTLLFTPEAGAVEADAGHVYWTNNVGARQQLDNVLSADPFVESTGVVWGLTLRINVNPGLFDVVPGGAVVVDCWTTPGTTVKTPLSFPAGIVGITPMFGVGGRHPVYISLDGAGNVLQSTSAPSSSDYTRNVFLGVIAVDPGTHTVAAVYQLQSTSYAATARFAQLVTAMGSFNMSGNVYGPSAAPPPNLNLSRTAGQVYRLGANYGVDPRSPDAPFTNSADPEHFFPISHLAGNWYYPPAPVTAVDPNFYDDLTNLAAMTAGWFQIKAIFYSPSIVFIQYGQAQYPTLADARLHVDDPFLIDPILTGDFVFRGFLIIQQGCADWTDSSKYLFITAGKWGLAGGGGSGGTGGEVNTASNIGVGGVGFYAQKLGVDLEFKNLRSVTSKLTVTDNPPLHTVDVDLAPVHTPFQAATTAAGLLTLTDGRDAYMVDGAEDLLGISTAGRVPGDSVNMTFTSPRWLRNGAAVGVGFAPLLLVHVPGLAGYQDVDLADADGRCTFQLRADARWQLIAGGLS